MIKILAIHCLLQSNFVVNFAALKFLLHKKNNLIHLHILWQDVPLVRSERYSDIVLKQEQRQVQIKARTGSKQDHAAVKSKSKLYHLAPPPLVQSAHKIKKQSS